MISEKIIPVIKSLVYLLIIILLILILIFFLVSCGLFYYQDYRFNTKDSINNVIGDNVDFFYVKQVIDGDTFLLDNGEMVRMLGINTPEIDRYYYHEAKDLLDLMINKKRVKLCSDVTDRDKYGRLLRYVYIGDLFVNMEMLKRGFASVFTMPPDVMFAQDFIEAERYARENNLGLWAESQENTDIRLSLKFDARGDDRKNLNDEYLMLENESNSDFNIDGWTIKDDGTSIYEFRNFLFLKDSKIYLFSGNGMNSDGNFYWNSDIPIWNNDHDSVFLRDKNGLLILFFRY